MRILLIAAVDFELEAARRVWSAGEAAFLLGGVGAGSTRTVLEAALAADRYDRVLDIGIAGTCAERQFPLGSVVHVTADRHGEGDGAFLCNPAPWPELEFLPSCRANTLQALDDRFRLPGADVESMEGAAFFEVCLRAGVSFAQIRAVSNVVGVRDHALWDIPLSLKNLESALQTLKTRLPK